jgi:DNA replication factor GINS
LDEPSAPPADEPPAPAASPERAEADADTGPGPGADTGPNLGADAGPNLGADAGDGTDDRTADPSDDDGSSIPGLPRTTVRITDDVGEVVGADDRDYDLGSGTVVTLPEPNADVLVDKDAAERL